MSCGLAPALKRVQGTKVSPPCNWSVGSNLAYRRGGDDKKRAGLPRAFVFRARLDYLEREPPWLPELPPFPRPEPLSLSSELPRFPLSPPLC